MTRKTSHRYRAMKSCAAQARKILVARGLPEPLKAKLEIDLRDALRRGFLVDLEQLEVALARISA